MGPLLKCCLWAAKTPNLFVWQAKTIETQETLEAAVSSINTRTKISIQKWAGCWNLRAERFKSKLWSVRYLEVEGIRILLLGWSTVHLQNSKTPALVLLGTRLTVRKRLKRVWIRPVMMQICQKRMSRSVIQATNEKLVWKCGGRRCKGEKEKNWDTKSLRWKIYWKYNGSLTLITILAFQT